MGGLIIGLILILVGISALTGISFGSFIVAVILIAIGIRIIARHSGPNGWHHHYEGGDGHDHGQAHSSHGYYGNVHSSEMSIDEVAIFSSLNKTLTTPNFKGGRIVMVFSGGELDLTQVKTEVTEIHLDIASVFSGIEIIIPREWKVKSTANVFLGKVDTHQAQAGSDGDVTLIIHGDAVFGEIEVRK